MCLPFFSCLVTRLMALRFVTAVVCTISKLSHSVLISYSESQSRPNTKIALNLKPGANLYSEKCSSLDRDLLLVYLRSGLSMWFLFFFFSSWDKMAVSIRRSAPHGPVGTSRGERNGFHKGGSCSGPMKRRQHICRGEIKPFYSVFLAFFSSKDAE